ncbi:MAG TPA: hypothetical protein VGR07_17345, partial [Thermoanaerobaculia bacterium]|nr:hypothetical protein [Thermoanaerobaculia bacterium]
MSELFDELTRILGSRLPRRQAIRLIVGGTVGTYLALRWPKMAWAATVSPTEEACTENPVACRKRAGKADQCCPQDTD